MTHRAAGCADIGDYAIIGNCHTAALVSKTGCIDWWCPYRFDSPAVFAALLDDDTGGRWWVGPSVPATSTRRYLPDTNVLETTFHTDGGVLRLVDFMPMRGGKGGIRDGIEPRVGIVRLLHCIEGVVPVATEYEPRWDYGRLPARLRDRGTLGIYCEHRGDALMLRSDVPTFVDADGHRVTGRATMRAGDCRCLVVTFADDEPLIVPPTGPVAALLLDETIDWWRRWLKHCRYGGPYQQAVHRSALVLKLLCYAPSGAVIASPTTSLPETIGGVRNWDYRYCWLRDASMTLGALLDLGFAHEADQFLNWLLTATQLTAPRLEVFYDLFGNHPAEERTLDWLDGHRQSRPVRVGNGAARQHQLDLYGEVAAAALAHVRCGGRLGGWQARRLVGLGEHVCAHWREPDSGIWEPRGPRRHFTHSKVNSCRGLLALIELGEGGHLGIDPPLARFRDAAAAIRAWVEREAWSEDLCSYVSWAGGREVDASLLLLGIQGFADPKHPRMASTYRHLHRELAQGVTWRRYRPGWPDGLPGVEGAFGICSFWAIEYLARAGRSREAEAAFGRLLAYANDVGLFAEEIDPTTRAALGNFPQGFTHVGLISAALAIVEAPATKPEVV